jgi:predicted AAA+ superfamily ATPase
MSIFPLETVLKLLNAHNPWWRAGDIRQDRSYPVKRFGYYQALRIINSASGGCLVTIISPHQTGKTQILFQLIHTLIEQGVNQRRIIYLPLNHPVFKFFSPENILNICHDNLYGGDDIIYFLDDVESLDDWTTFLLQTSARLPKAKIISAGSLNPDAQNKAEKLNLLYLPTLSFYEYCQITGVENLPKLKGRVTPSTFANMSRQEMADLFRKLAPLRKPFLNYLYMGGFPRFYVAGFPLYAEDDIRAQRLLEDGVVGKVINYDLPPHYNIRNTRDLTKVF